MPLASYSWESKTARLPHVRASCLRLNVLVLMPLPDLVRIWCGNGFRRFLDQL